MCYLTGFYYCKEIKELDNAFYDDKRMEWHESTIPYNVFNNVCDDLVQWTFFAITKSSSPCVMFSLLITKL